MPLRLALAAAAARGRRMWNDPAARERARATAEAVTGRGPHVDRVARAHLAAHAAREELILRPWANRKLPVLGLEHLEAARASGRGVIVSHCHHGPFPGFSGTVARFVPGLNVVVGTWMLVDQPHPVEGRRQRAWRSMFEREGANLVDASGSFAELERLLCAGEVVSNTFDMPGSHETRFLRKPVMLAAGTARLAAATGALVVPAARVMRRYRPMTTFGPAIDPRAHADWKALHQALADHFSERILWSPEWLEDPRRGGAWEDGATADAWVLPAR